MKVLFLGYAVSSETNKNLTGKSEAGNKMELSILYHLNKMVDQLDVITVYPIAPFPKDSLLIVRDEKIELGNDICSNRVGFFNIPIIKQITQTISVYNAAAKITKRNKNVIVMSFNMYPQVGVPAVLLKKKYGCKVVPFLADLPIDDNYQRKSISKWIRKVFNNITKKCILNASDVIVLNKHARDVFAPKSRYLIVDGGFEPALYPADAGSEKSGDVGLEKHIVYTGSLAEYSGIMNLISSMKLIKNENIVLDIYGSGNLESVVKKVDYKNVHYHGSVAHEKILAIQRNAWLLINPRPIDDEIAMVTFPSKIFEYMVSGTPVLTTRLNGFSDEYEGKLFFADDNEPETLACCINRLDLMTAEELKEVSQKARDFVLEHKTWEKQMERVCQFLNDI